MWTGATMQLETKFLRLRQAVKLRDEIDGWQVYWLGGWGKGQMFYFVMVVRVGPATNFLGGLRRFCCGADEG
jgi:hypothetical protein